LKIGALAMKQSFIQGRICRISEIIFLIKCLAEEAILICLILKLLIPIGIHLHGNFLSSLQMGFRLNFLGLLV
jgi:hypothetical protein